MGLRKLSKRAPRCMEHLILSSDFAKTSLALHRNASQKLKAGVALHGNVFFVCMVQIVCPKGSPPNAPDHSFQGLLSTRGVHAQKRTSPSGCQRAATWACLGVGAQELFESCRGTLQERPGLPGSLPGGEPRVPQESPKSFSVNRGTRAALHGKNLVNRGTSAALHWSLPA